MGRQLLPGKLSLATRVCTMHLPTLGINLVLDEWDLLCRTYRYDIMTASSVEYNGLQLELDFGDVDALRGSMSRTTLAYLDDTGFYTVDYSLAGLQKWGWQQGCDFVTQECSEWAEQNPGQTHFCDFPIPAVDSAELLSLEVRAPLQFRSIA